MLYDDLARDVHAQYGLMLWALAGRYHQMRAPGAVVTPHALVGLRTDTTGIAQTFLSGAEREIEHYLASLLSDASDELASALVTSKKVLLAQVRAMVLENMRQINRMARTGAAGPADMLKGATGAVGLLIQSKAGQVVFKATDTSGRKWMAEALMRTIVRDFAYQAYVQTQLDQYAQTGLDTVMTSKGPATLNELQAQWESYFHPNAHTTIADPYVPT
jgi:hypothetical protein